MPYKDPEVFKQKMYEGHLRRKFGITFEQYVEILQKQDNRCAVCRRTKDQYRRRFSVDHDHSTGLIRGLLCTFCNRFVIGRHRIGTGGVELFQRASEYLKQDLGLKVPTPAKKKRRKRGRKSALNRTR